MGRGATGRERIGRDATYATGDDRVADADAGDVLREAVADDGHRDAAAEGTMVGDQPADERRCPALGG